MCHLCSASKLLRANGLSAAAIFAVWALTTGLFGMNSLCAADSLKLLFLGDQGHHRPADFASRLVPVMDERGIGIQYTEDVNMLDTAKLAPFDGLIVYANIDKISPQQEEALLKFVANGKGFIPIHCASYCFRNSQAYVDLVGAQFQRHGGEVFATEIVQPDHPLIAGYHGFKSWDETYVHHQHNEKNRIVLEVRRQGTQSQGNIQEPWTWVRTHGKGRVFYTAWGHDTRTWAHSGFHNLLERGIRWACQDDPSKVVDYTDPALFPVPKMTAQRKDVAPFTYTEVGSKIPNYTPGQKWGVQASPMTKMQNPLPPEESIKHFVTPDGFRPELWASEANFQGKPIAMNWDEAGRLWICETVDYPNELQPPEGGRDRIRICEDTDGDQKADKFTVFAEKLSIPTAIVCYRGGAIVQDGVETVYLKDLNGDGRADFRQVLITGWSLGDTHGGVSNFQYGLDNWIWAMQGYNDSQPVINGEPQQRFRQGFWRFRVEAGAPDATAPVKVLGDSKIPAATIAQHTVRVKKLEFVRATNNNTWGLGISEEGLIFGSTANRNPSNFMPIANRYYERVRGWAPDTLQMISENHLFQPITDKVRQVDHHGGYTAGAGHALYTARNYPQAWWNRVAFVCGPTGHLVGTFVLERDGAGYKSKSPFNLIASDDEWSAPIMAEVGPDGNVWVLDWYNFIVQHNPTPHGFTTGKGNAYESDLRDKKHGRIYRVVCESQPSTPSKADSVVAKGLESSTSEQLVAALTHTNMLWRKHAQRLLIERSARDEATVAGLLKLLGDTQTDAIGLSPGALHAVWTLHGLGLIAADQPKVLQAVRQALKHPSAGVRLAATQSLSNQAGEAVAIADADLLKDADLQVQLAAMLMIADAPSIESSVAAMLVEWGMSSTVNSDRWLLDSWTSAAAMHWSQVLPELLTRSASSPVPPSILARLPIIAEHLARSRPKGKTLVTMLASMDKAAPEVLVPLFSGLTAGWPKDHRIEIPKEAADRLIPLMDRIPVATKSQLLQLAGFWGATAMQEQIAKIVDQLLAQVEDDKVADKQRVDAAKQILSMQSDSDSLVASLLDLITPQTSSEVSQGLLDALVESRSPQVGPLLAARAGSYTPSVRATAIRVLLARPETTLAMLTAMKERKLQMSDLQLDQRQALSSHPNAEVRKVAKEIISAGGGLPSPDREKVLKDWMSVAHEKGNATNGKAIFTKHCAVCHRHGTEGQNIGPELTGMAVHPKHELLVHILDPNRSVEGNFRTFTVLTADGVVLNGMLAGESKTSIELIDTQGKRTNVLREDIEELNASPKSLMPEGFEGQIKREEMQDLLEFLTSKGKYVPLSLASVATAISTRGLFHEGDNGPDRLVFSDWSPKMFKGVPFQLIDPQGKKQANIVLLHGPNGTLPPSMPKTVKVVCNAPAAAIHLLGGVSGWGHPASEEGSVSMIVRLHYADGSKEDHPLINGKHIADYIRRVDVPDSEFAFNLKGQQLRYLKIVPQRKEPLQEIDLVKGPDGSAPIVVALTLESP